MFNYLATKNSMDDDTSVSDQDATIDYLIDQLPDIPHNRIKVMQILDTKAELKALASAVETYGLSKSLLAFADHNGILSSVVPGIPSLETLSADLSVSEEKEVVDKLRGLQLEAAEERLTLSQFISTAALGVVYSVVFNWFFAFIVMVGLYRIYSKLNVKIDNHVVRAMPFDTTMRLIKSPDASLHVFETMFNLDLPKTEEEYDTFLRKVTSICSPLKTIGVQVNGEKVVVDSIMVPGEKKLDALGYKDSSLSDIATGVGELKPVFVKMRDLRLSKWAAAYKDKTVTKNEKKIMNSAFYLGEDIYDTVIHRYAKILRLVKSDLRRLKLFYVS